MSDQVEALCENPDAMITYRGFTPETPCGVAESWGVGWCNRKNFNDWLEKLRKTLNAADKQWASLTKLYMSKGKSFSDEEKEILNTITKYKTNYNVYDKVNKEDLSSKDVAEYIAKMITDIGHLNCIIEEGIQQRIIDNEGVVTPTYLVKAKRGEGSATGTVLTVLAVGVIGVIAWKLFL